VLGFEPELVELESIAMLRQAQVAALVRSDL
jgi:hypothetical protein